MILGWHFQKITSLVPAVWNLAKLAPGKFKVGKSTSKDLWNSRLGIIDPLLNFRRKADLVL